MLLKKFLNIILVSVLLLTPIIGSFSFKSKVKATDTRVQFDHTEFVGHVTPSFNYNDIISNLEKQVDYLAVSSTLGKEKIALDGYDTQTMKMAVEAAACLAGYSKDSNEIKEYQKTKTLPEGCDQDEERIKQIDRRIYLWFSYILGPEVTKGVANEKIHLERVNKDYTSEQRCESQESELADEESSKVNRSSHCSEDRGTGMDVSGKDYIKCTTFLLDKDDNITDKIPLPPIPILFKYAYQNSGRGQGGTDNGFDFANILTDIVKNGGANFHQYFGGLGLSQAMSIISEKLGEEGLDIDLSNLANFQGNGANIFSNLGGVLLGDNMQLPTEFGSMFGGNFQETINNMGKATLSQVFNDVLPPDSFVGDNFQEWSENIGKRVLEEKMHLAKGTLDGTTSEEELENAGQREMENLLGLAQYSLDNLAGDYDGLAKVIGAGLISKNIPGGFDGLQNAYDLSHELTANALGISVESLQNNIGNPEELKKIVGLAVIANNIESYQEYEIPDYTSTPTYTGPFSTNINTTTNPNNPFSQSTLGKINSRDEAFGLVNYKKPYVDFQEKKIIAYDQDDPAKVTGEYELEDVAGYTKNYELLLTNLQNEHSLIKKFLTINSTEDLTKVYKEIGITKIAKSLSNIEDEQMYIQKWLSSGEIPKDDDGRYRFDTEKLGLNLGLKDKYDLYRIFIDGRGYEVFDRIGTESINLALNPSVTDYLNNYDTNQNQNYDTDRDLYLSLGKINEIEELVKSLSNNDAKNKILNSTQAAKTSQNTKVEDIILNSRQDQIKSSFNNIGRIIKEYNLQNDSVGKEIISTINESISHKESNPLGSEDTQNLRSVLSLDITKVKLENYLKSGENININDMVKEAGIRALSYALMTDDFKDAKIETALNKISNGSDPMQTVTSLLGPKLDKVAKTLNIGFGSQTVDLSGEDLAGILTGKKPWTLLEKISNPILSKAFNLSGDGDFLALLKGNQDVANLINPSKWLQTFGIDSSFANMFQDLFKGFGSSEGFSKTATSIGQKLSSVMFFGGLPAGDDFGLILGQFNAIASEVQNLFSQGQQIPKMLEGFNKGLGGIGIFNYVTEAINQGNLVKTFAETAANNAMNAIVSIFNPTSNSEVELLGLGVSTGALLGAGSVGESGVGSIVGAAGLTGASLGSVGWESFLPEGQRDTKNLLNLFRTGSGLGLEALQGKLGEFMGQFNGALSGLNEDLQKNLSNALKDIGLEKIIGDIKLDISSLNLAGILQSDLLKDLKLDLGSLGDIKGISPDFVKNLLTGDPQKMLGSVKEIFGTKLQGLFNDPESGPLAQSVFDAITSGNPANLTNTAFSFAQNQLENVLGDIGLSSDLASGLLNGLKTGDLGNLQNLVSLDNIKEMFGGSLDKMLGLENFTSEFNNMFADLNGAFGDFNGILGSGNFDLGQLGNLQGLMGNLTSSLTNTVIGQLGGAFEGLEESLGLESGTISGLISSFVISGGTGLIAGALANFIPLGNLGLGPLGGALGGILGIGGQSKKRTFCALDYYPGLESVKTYNLAYWPSKDNKPTDEYDKEVEEKIGESAEDRFGGNKTFELKPQSKLKDKLKLAAELKIYQYYGEQLAIGEKTGDKDLLPLQLFVPGEEMMNKLKERYEYLIQSVFGIISESGDNIGEVLFTQEELWEQRLQRTFSGGLEQGLLAGPNGNAWLHVAM